MGKRKEIRMFDIDNKNDLLIEKEVEFLKLKGMYLGLNKWRNEHGNYKK